MGKEGREGVNLLFPTLAIDPVALDAVELLHLVLADLLALLTSSLSLLLLEFLSARRVDRFFFIVGGAVALLLVVTFLILVLVPCRRVVAGVVAVVLVEIHGLVWCVKAERGVVGLGQVK
jgi:hypothetical protein